MDYRKLTALAFETYKEHPLLKIAHCLREKDEYFPYIPLDNFWIAAILEDMSKMDLTNKKFIDIGCGIPVIPRLVSVLGCNESKGLEYNKVYTRYFNDLIEGDLLTYDFSKYDILYSYNPIHNGDLMKQGLKNIMKTMKRGAVLYFVDACGVTRDIKQLKRYSNFHKYKKR